MQMQLFWIFPLFVFYVLTSENRLTKHGFEISELDPNRIVQYAFVSPRRRVYFATKTQNIRIKHLYPTISTLFSVETHFHFSNARSVATVHLPTINRATKQPPAYILLFCLSLRLSFCVLVGTIA